MPDFDHYVGASTEPRAIFCNKLGLDPSKKIILFCPMGKAFSDSDWELLEVLQELIKKGDLYLKTQVIVRYPPNDTVEQKSELDKNIFVIDIPGTRFTSERGVDWDMSFKDLEHLRNTLTHSDVVICPPSTMTIDAAIWDKPVINIGFDGKVPRPRHKSFTRFYYSTHYGRLLRHNGVSLPETAEELRQTLLQYLNNPEIHREGRKKIVEEQCGVLDGQAGNRIGNFILSFVKV